MIQAKECPLYPEKSRLMPTFDEFFSQPGERKETTVGNLGLQLARNLEKSGEVVQHALSFQGKTPDSGFLTLLCCPDSAAFNFRQVYPYVTGLHWVRNPRHRSLAYSTLITEEQLPINVPWAWLIALGPLSPRESPALAAECAEEAQLVWEETVSGENSFEEWQNRKAFWLGKLLSTDREHYRREWRRASYEYWLVQRALKKKGSQLLYDNPLSGRREEVSVSQTGCLQLPNGDILRRPHFDPGHLRPRTLPSEVYNVLENGKIYLGPS